MEDFKKRNKILVVISVFILLVVALLVSKATYSFLDPLDPDDVIIDSEITATGDTLLFTKGTDIDVVLSQDNFNSASGNLVRSVTPQVKLIASNKTNNATANYYVTANIKENTFQYTNGTSNPEILLTVTDNDGNPLTTCTGLTYTTVGGVSGFDITDKMGVYDFAVQTISTTSSTTGTTKNWTYTVTFINKTTDQSINEDAKIDIEAILHKEPETFCELNPDNGGCRLTLSYNPIVSKNVTLENGYIYYHDDTLENGAGDYSYRYAGANPNNYICFGSDAATCPAENIYRIIGLMPVDVVTDGTTTPVTTERQMLYKIIKNDYATSTELGMTSPGNASKASNFNGPTGNQPSGNIQGFQWGGSVNTNTWTLSTLNTTGLNTNYLTNLGNSWSNLIANVMWKVGGVDYLYVQIATPMSLIYTSEILESGNNATYASSDGKTEIDNKIGLIYISDYAYATPQNNWTTSINVSYYSNVTPFNWLYRGVSEWLITRNTKSPKNSHLLSSGFLQQATGYTHSMAVRPTFYLTEDTVIDMTNHAGTLADPYRIKMDYVYWNDNFSSITYTSTQVPTGTGLNGTYQTREQLATAYSNWSNNPIYIKTTKVNGTVTGHTACLWYNNREFCIAPDYWNTDVATTKAKLKADMENALGITIADSSCYSGTSYARCLAGDFSCYADSYGNVTCDSGVTDGYCGVDGSGGASCGG